MMRKYLLSILFCVLLLPPAVQAKTKYVIDYFKIMVRSQPGAEYKIIDQLPSNEKVRTVQVEGNWVKIAFKGNRTGWVLQQYLTAELPKGIRIADLEKKVIEQEKKIQSLDEENFSLKKKNVEVGQSINDLSSENQSLKEEPFRILLLLAGGGIFLIGCITTLILQSMGRKKRGSGLTFDRGIGP
jgi:uncharacterized protein YgiM (DUF1202 family)